MRFRKLKKQTKTNKVITKKSNEANRPRYVDKIKAFITDMFMIYMPILYLIAYGVLDGKDDFQASEFAPFIGVLLYAIISAIFLSKSGQTPGKKAYEMQVVDSVTLKKIGFFRALFRFIAFLLSATSIFGVLMPLFRKDKASLHDILASTTVLVLKESST